MNLFSLNLPFFWDCILHSKVAGFYFYHNFSTLILPTEIDAGHPPFFGIYLAMAWKIFGRSLAVSHLAMLPFLLGAVYQFSFLVKRFHPQNAFHFAMVLCCLQPTWLAQSTMPSADVILVFGYLWGLNSILKNNKLGLMVALVLMLSVSLRGVVGVAALAATQVLLFKKDALKNWLSYLISSALFCAWIFYHYQKTGWAISTPAEGWSYGRGITTAPEMLRNILVIIKNHFDFGGIIIWGFVLGFILLKWKTISEAKPLLILWLIPILLFSVSLIPFGNPIMHRYYLVGYLLLILVAVYFAFQLQSQLKRNLILGVIALAFISGNFWIYPNGIANGWDATAAHIPYFKLREKMIDFIQQEKIPTSEIGTSFPNIDGTKFSDLDTTSWSFKPKDLAKDKYVFQSNIFNGFEDAELAELHSNKWILKKEFTAMQVYVRLYVRRY